MTSEILELEGTWEEILQQADKLAGHRLRVTVLADTPVTSKRLSEFYGILPATKPYPGKAEIRSNVAHSLAQQNLKNNVDQVIAALKQMASVNVDFLDAYLAEIARKEGEAIVSFDRDFRRLGIPWLEPE